MDQGLPPCVCIGTNIRAICEYNDNDPDNPQMVELDYEVNTPVELVWGMRTPLYAAASSQLNAETVATTNRCGAFDQAKPGSGICRNPKGEHLLRDHRVG